MQRQIIVTFLGGIAAVAALWLLLQTPGSLTDALAHPISTLVGTGGEINSILLDFSRYPEPIRAAGERLLQPFGIVRLVRTYRAPDAEHIKRR